MFILFQVWHWLPAFLYQPDLSGIVVTVDNSRSSSKFLEFILQKGRKTNCIFMAYILNITSYLKRPRCDILKLNPPPCRVNRKIEPNIC